MHHLELVSILSRNGVYVLSDSKYPGFSMPIVVSGAIPDENILGSMHVLVCGAPVSPDSSQWRETVTVSGGPFTAETCEEATRADELREIESELTECELDAWKGIVERSLPILAVMADLLRAMGRESEAAAAKDVIADIEKIRIAERITAKISEDATLWM